jgi:hypothetical protein
MKICNFDSLEDKKFEEKILKDYLKHVYQDLLRREERSKLGLSLPVFCNVRDFYFIK